MLGVVCRGIAGVLLPSTQIAASNLPSCICGSYLNRAIQGLTPEMADILGHVGLVIMSGWVGRKQPWLSKPSEVELSEIDATWLLFEKFFSGTCCAARLLNTCWSLLTGQ